MTFQKPFVLEKLSLIDKYTDEIEHLFRFSKEEILADDEKMHVAERLCQLIVDVMIDINQHFIKELDLKISDDLQGTFYNIAENGLLPEDFAKKIAPVVGLHNRIVHRYEKLDKKLFIRTLERDRDDFRQYIKHINGYLKKSLKEGSEKK